MRKKMCNCKIGKYSATGKGYSVCSGCGNRLVYGVTQKEHDLFIKQEQIKPLKKIGEK